MKIDILRKVDRFSKYPENQSPLFLVFILVFLCNCFGKRFDSANFECYLQQIRLDNNIDKKKYFAIRKRNIE